MSTWRYGALFGWSLYSNACKHIIKISLDTIATISFLFSYCKGSVGSCREDDRVAAAGSPTLAGGRSHLNFCTCFCIVLVLSSNKLLMSTHLFFLFFFFHVCYSHPTSFPIFPDTRLLSVNIQTCYCCSRVVSRHIYAQLLHKTLYCHRGDQNRLNSSAPCSLMPHTLSLRVQFTNI